MAKSLAGLKLARAGRFLVHGRHDRGAVKPNDLGLEIEAGEAFGTGHHGTTAGCLIAIERAAKTYRIRNALLDVGTGSGVLAIALARLAKARVLASDIDPVATRVADENVRLNGAAAFWWTRHGGRARRARLHGQRPLRPAHARTSSPGRWRRSLQRSAALWRPAAR